MKVERDFGFIGAKGTCYHCGTRVILEKNDINKICAYREAKYVPERTCWVVYWTVRCPVCGDKIDCEGKRE